MEDQLNKKKLVGNYTLHIKASDNTVATLKKMAQREKRTMHNLANLILERGLKQMLIERSF